MIPCHSTRPPCMLMRDLRGIRDPLASKRWWKYKFWGWNLCLTSVTTHGTVRCKGPCCFYHSCRVPIRCHQSRCQFADRIQRAKPLKLINVPALLGRLWHFSVSHRKLPFRGCSSHNMGRTPSGARTRASDFDHRLSEPCTMCVQEFYPQIRKSLMDSLSALIKAR